MAILLLLDQTRTWATVKLPEFAALTPAPSQFSRSLAGAAAPWDPWPLQAVLIVAWAAAAVRSWRDDPTLVLAGALAASTSVARTSFDYNLITALPAVDAALLAGLAAVAGHRILVGHTEGAPTGRVFLLWAWLVASAVLAAWRPATPAEAGFAAAEGEPA